MRRDIDKVAGIATYRNNVRANKALILELANKSWDERPSNTIWGWWDYLLNLVTTVVPYCHGYSYTDKGQKWLHDLLVKN